MTSAQESTSATPADSVQRALDSLKQRPVFRAPEDSAQPNDAANETTPWVDLARANAGVHLYSD